MKRLNNKEGNDGMGSYHLVRLAEEENLARL